MMPPHEQEEEKWKKYPIWLADGGSLILLP